MSTRSLAHPGAPLRAPAHHNANAMLGPMDLDTLVAELLKRYGPSVTIRTEWEACGSAGQTVWLGEKKVASITARPIHPVQMPRDIGRPQGPREYVLMLNGQFSEPTKT